MESYRREQKDRRRFRRMPARDGCFVIFNNHRSLVGRIVDIGCGGLRCLINGSLSSLGERGTLSLVGYQKAEQVISLLDLPLESFKEENSLTKVSHRLTNIRLTFGPLSPQQRSRLALFFRSGQV